MTQYTAIHALDQATALQTGGENQYLGRFPPAYANMVGPFGGIIAATVLNSVLSHPDRQGDPVSITVNFTGPVADAPYEITARIARTNGSNQHWVIELTQDGATAVTATALLASRRDGWEGADIAMPDVPAPGEVERLETGAYMSWLNNYEFRVVKGGFDPDGQEGERSDATTGVWVRDSPPRPLDYRSLLAISDSFFPRIFVRRQQRLPASTVSLTTYFHADASSLAAQGDRHLYCEARASRYHQGFFDQVGQLWGADGDLLATTHQLVYFKG